MGKCTLFHSTKLLLVTAVSLALWFHLITRSDVYKVVFFQLQCSQYWSGNLPALEILLGNIVFSELKKKNRKKNVRLCPRIWWRNLKGHLGSVLTDSMTFRFSENTRDLLWLDLSWGLLGLLILIWTAPVLSEEGCSFPTLRSEAANCCMINMSNLQNIRVKHA